MRVSRWICFALLLVLFAAGCNPLKPGSTQPARIPQDPVLDTQPAPVAQPTAAAENYEAGGWSGPLSVIIESPPVNVTVTDATITIRGYANPETVISIQDAFIVVPENRQFSTDVSLVEGINLIEIIASDVEDNQDVVYLTVVYEPEP